MHPGRIQHATRTLGKPVDWDKAEQGPCGSLSIRDEDTSAGPGMTSAWLPTPEEIQRIASGAPVLLTVMGTVHPPVMLWVGKKPE